MSDNGYDFMEAEAEAEERARRLELDLDATPVTKVPLEGLVAAGGWCAPNLNFFDIFRKSTPEELEIEKLQRKVRKLRKLAKIQSRQIALLINALEGRR